MSHMHGSRKFCQRGPTLLYLSKFFFFFFLGGGGGGVGDGGGCCCLYVNFYCCFFQLLRGESIQISL